VLGSALLTGWNAFLTASDYFGTVFPVSSTCVSCRQQLSIQQQCPLSHTNQATSPPHTTQGRSIDRVFTVAYLPITLVLIGLVSRWPHLFGSPSTRITTGYCLFTASCAAVPLVGSSWWQEAQQCD
jgi:hypothetical protein